MLYACTGGACALETRRRFVTEREQEAISQKEIVFRFRKRYSKSENGWNFDFLCMRSPGVWGDLCKCVALRVLIRSVARAYAL